MIVFKTYGSERDVYLKIKHAHYIFILPAGTFLKCHKYVRESGLHSALKIRFVSGAL